MALNPDDTFIYAYTGWRDVCLYVTDKHFVPTAENIPWRFGREGLSVASVVSGNKYYGDVEYALLLTDGVETRELFLSVEVHTEYGGLAVSHLQTSDMVTSCWIDDANNTINLSVTDDDFATWSKAVQPVVGREGVQWSFYQEFDEEDGYLTGTFLKLTAGEDERIYEFNVNKDWLGLEVVEAHPVDGVNVNVWSNQIGISLTKDLVEPLSVETIGDLVNLELGSGVGSAVFSINSDDEWVLTLTSKDGSRSREYSVGVWSEYPLYITDSQISGEAFPDYELYSQTRFNGLTGLSTIEVSVSAWGEEGAEASAPSVEQIKDALQFELYPDGEASGSWSQSGTDGEWIYTMTYNGESRAYRLVVTYE